MKIAILGMGGIGLGLAAVLASKADICLWSPSFANETPDTEPVTFRSSGIVEGEFRARATSRMADALEGADVVIVAVPGDAHKAVIDLAVPCLDERQMVVISSQMSLSALYLSKKLGEREKSCLIVAWATTAVTAGRTGPRQVHMSSIRKQVLTSALPSDLNEEAIRRCGDLLGDVFAVAPDLLAVTLSNVNPPAHLANALCNLTRMEYGEDWGTYYGMSGAVGRLIEALDLERSELAAAFGLSLHTVQEHLHKSFDLPLGSVADMAREQNNRRNGNPPGPKTLDHRFVTEDVPFGIVPVLEIAKIAEVDMPIHMAGLKLMSALYGRDFARENDIIPNLDLASLSKREFHNLIKDGSR